MSCMIPLHTEINASYNGYISAELPTETVYLEPYVRSKVWFELVVRILISSQWLESFNCVHKIRFADSCELITQPIRLIMLYT